jgi:hypothetical protein
MNPDLEVDADDVRRTASAIAETAARVAAGAEQHPPSPEPSAVGAGQSAPGGTPRWVTADPALLAAAAAQHQLAVLGADIADTARRVTAAAADYELADARAVTRLRLTR